MAPQDLDSETVFRLQNMHLILKPDANPQCLAMTMIDEQKQNLLLQHENLNVTVFLSTLG